MCPAYLVRVRVRARVRVRLEVHRVQVHAGPPAWRDAFGFGALVGGRGGAEASARADAGRVSGA